MAWVGTEVGFVATTLALALAIVSGGTTLAITAAALAAFSAFIAVEVTLFWFLDCLLQ